MSAEDSKLKSEGQGGGEWDHTFTKEEGGTLPAVRDTTVISGKPDAKVSPPCQEEFPPPPKETIIDKLRSVCIYFVPSPSPLSPSLLSILSLSSLSSPSLFHHSFVFPSFLLHTLVL